MKTNLVYLNGSLISEKEAMVSIHDRGFLYGDGLFETMRVYSGSVFKLEEHLKRLFLSAGVISLSISQSKGELKKAIYEILRANGLENARLRLTVSRGGSPGLDPPVKSKSTIVITAEPILPYPERLYEKGLKATVVETRRDAKAPLCRIKSLNYLPNILAKLEANKKRADDGIILNNKSYLTEATASNIFLVSNERIITPSLESGILSGITRQTILKIAISLGMEVVEREVKLYELTGADESFLTNSIREIVPLVEVDGFFIGKGKPGKITKRLMEVFKKETMTSQKEEEDK